MMPADMNWPTWRDQPLIFMAQLALRDLAGTAVSAASPVDGLLSFWYAGAEHAWGFDAAESGAARVIHFPDGTDLVERDELDLYLALPDALGLGETSRSTASSERPAPPIRQRVARHAMQLAHIGCDRWEALTGFAHPVTRSWADPGDQLGLGTLSKRGVRHVLSRAPVGARVRRSDRPPRPTKGSATCAAPAHSGNTLKGNLRS